MKDLRIAAVVTHAPVGGIRQNLDKMVQWVHRAQAQKVDLICFPELNISGYSNHPDIHKAAQPVPGPVSDTILRLAQESKMTILAGTAEIDSQERIFAAHLVAFADGRLGIYRKLHIAPPEQTVYTPGDQIPVFDLPQAVFGIQLCYDAHFPELSTAMALKGVDIIFIPHASPRDTPDEKHRSWMRHLTARAYDNGVFIVACNQCGNNGKGLTFPGNAVVLAPSGDIIKEHLSGEEALLVADLKADDLNQVRKNKMRYFLPHRRPDIYGIGCTDTASQ